MKTILLIIQFLILGFLNAQELMPTLTDACLIVNVTDGKRNPLSGEKVTFENALTKKDYSGITRDDGRFKILIPKNATYKIKYRNFSSDMDYATITLPPARDTLVEFTETITINQPKTYTLNDVFFDSGKASLRPESFKELNALAEYMTLKKTLVIEIAGHTDNVGVIEANQKLSDSRANSVKDYLVKKGINQTRLKAVGYGDTQPLTSNSTEAGKQKNRRTEVRIITQ
jgi:OOP family OmpA-OmpF porin